MHALIINITLLLNMACLLALGHFFPVMPLGQLQNSKEKAKSQVVHVNNLFTSNIQS